MLLDQTNIRKWARRQGWTPGERGMLAEMVDDLCHRCEACSERFTSRDDMATDEDGILTGFCEACEDCGFAPESTYRAHNGSVVG